MTSAGLSRARQYMQQQNQALVCRRLAEAPVAIDTAELITLVPGSTGIRQHHGNILEYWVLQTLPEPLFAPRIYDCLLLPRIYHGLLP